ncbi:MAG: hypothetical protein N2595_05600 [bacterium]|nr:hypothetical protein [bacterium]
MKAFVEGLFVEIVAVALALGIVATIVVRRVQRQRGGGVWCAVAWLHARAVAVRAVDWVRGVWHGVGRKWGAVLGYVIVVAGSWLAVWPVLEDSRLSILDCANVYRSYREIRWLEPRTWLYIDNDPTSVRPGEILVHLPAFFTVRAWAQYWYLNGMILSATMVGLFYLVGRASGSRLLGLCAVAASLTAPSFVENYYTLGKCEPFMIAGGIGVLWVLERILFRKTWEQWYGKALLMLIGVVSALMASTVKETAVAFVGIYVVSLAVLAWASPLGVGKALGRTAWLSGVIVIGLVVMVREYALIPRHYDQGGTAVYSLAGRNVVKGLAHIAGYYAQTVPSVFVVLMALGLSGRWRFRNFSDEWLRRSVAWLIVFVVMWLGYCMIYIPWSSPQVRYFLPGDVAMRAAIMVGIGLIVARTGGISPGWLGWLRRGAVVLAIVVMAAHSVFCVLVGHLSEGRARQQFDVAYDEMFKYIAGHTPHGGTAYFMYDPAHEESRYNTRFGMPLFYGRPDIRCVFAQKSSDFEQAGLVAVADAALSYNPNRMPVHALARRIFDGSIAREKAFTVVTNIRMRTELWYVDAKAYRGFQYRTRYGIPAFWELQRGQYVFGWSVYSYGAGEKRPNLVRNHEFTLGLTFWDFWGRVNDETNTIKVVNRAVRIESASGEMRGVKQHVAGALVSGGVYRLSAAARTVGRADHSKVLGGRVAVHLPPQQDVELVWLSQHEQWQRRERIFTNNVDGQPVVLVHMGYGKIAATAEFTDVTLERQE